MRYGQWRTSWGRRRSVCTPTTNVGARCPPTSINFRVTSYRPRYARGFTVRWCREANKFSINFILQPSPERKWQAYATGAHVGGGVGEGMLYIYSGTQS